MTISEKSVGQVAIFEDNEQYRELLVALVTFCRHDVVIEGAALEQSLKAVEARARLMGGISLDAVLLDGNLAGGDTNEDGRQIASAIRGQAGGDEVFIVSIASHGLVEGADLSHSKVDAYGAVRIVDEHIKAKLQQP